MFYVTKDGKTELEVTRFYTEDATVGHISSGLVQLSCGWVYLNGFKDSLPKRGYFTLAEVEGADAPYIVDIVEIDEQKVE